MTNHLRHGLVFKSWTEDDLLSIILLGICSDRCFTVNGRSQEFTDTLQNASGKPAVRATSDSIWMAKQREMEKLCAKILKTDVES